MVRKIKIRNLAVALLALLILSANAWPANIVRPWRSTTAIVLPGERFEVWFNADNGQTVESIRLKGPFNTVPCTHTITSGDWEYDPLSGNRYNRRIQVTVPPDAPADRYDLVLETSDGDLISHGGVKVVKEYKKEYYIMHMSDGHIFQNGYDAYTLLARKSAMIDMADIMDCQIIIETGDNMYNVRNHPEREEIYFQGDDNMGIKGMADAKAATFLVPGDHDAYTANDWPQATVQVNSDFFNDYWGLQSSNFSYGNGRFMMLNNAWAVSETSAGDHAYQVDTAVSWLLDEGAGGNFFVTAGHCYNKIHEFIDDEEPLDLVLAGDKHHIRTNNPYSFDEGSAAIAYIAGAIRDHFEFNLFRVNNEAGTFTPVSGTNAVVEVLNSGNQDDKATWVPNLTLEFLNDNDGTSYENTATIVNMFDFPIEGATVRFVMPGEFDYRVTGGEIRQQFDGDEFRIVDVALDVAANSTVDVLIGDADLCPDDPDKTEPGLCGCGVPEGTCETSALTVNSGSGSGDYYPYELVTITADEAPADHTFDAWVIVTGEPDVSDLNAPTTQLQLLGHPAEVTATYKEIIYFNDAVFVSHLIPPLAPAGNATVRLTMKNTGNTTWTKAKGYRLGSQNPAGNTTWGMMYIDLTDTDSVLPGAEKTFLFEITGPETDQLYNFQWQMMQVESGYFGENSPNQTIRLTSSEEYLDDCDLLGNWKTSGTLVLNSTEKKQGASCLDYTGSNADEFKKAFSTPYNPKGSEEGTMLQFWYYVSDVSKLKGSNQVELGSAGKNDVDEYSWKMTGLCDGWNYIRLPIHEAGSIGNPDLSNINWFRLYQFKVGTINTKIDAIQLIGDEIYMEVALTVNNGTGSGKYIPGERVRIQANAAPEGEVFDSWVIHSGTLQVDDPGSSDTYVTIADTDAEISASYVTDPNLSVYTINTFQGFRLYPNPARNEVHLEFDLTKGSEVCFTLYDLTGTIARQAYNSVKLPEGKHQLSLAVDDVPPGSYVLKVDNEGRIFSLLLFIQ
jgi:hypothetical protein